MSTKSYAILCTVFWNKRAGWHWTKAYLADNDGNNVFVYQDSASSSAYTITEIIKLAANKGVLPEFNPHNVTWSEYLQENGIPYFVVNVSRKKDM